MTTIIIVGIIIVVIIYLTNSSSNQKDITLDDLYALYHSKLTELQKAEQYKTYGRVVGEGTVESVYPLDVEHHGAEYNYWEHYILVKVKPFSPMSHLEVTLWFPEGEKKKLLFLKKGQQIKFDAPLSSSYEAYDFSFHHGCTIKNIK